MLCVSTDEMIPLPPWQSDLAPIFWVVGDILSSKFSRICFVIMRRGVQEELWVTVWENDLCGIDAALKDGADINYQYARLSLNLPPIASKFTNITYLI